MTFLGQNVVGIPEEVAHFPNCQLCCKFCQKDVNDHKYFLQRAVDTASKARHPLGNTTGWAISLSAAVEYYSRTLELPKELMAVCSATIFSKAGTSTEKK